MNLFCSVDRFINIAENMCYNKSTMDPVLGVEKSKKAKKALLIVLILIVMVILAIVAIWYFGNPERREAIQVAKEVEQELEAQERTAEAVEVLVSPPALPIENVAPPTNPVEERVPEINPVERANPFAEEFENPFQ